VNIVCAERPAILDDTAVNSGSGHPPGGDAVGANPEGLVDGPNGSRRVNLRLYPTVLEPGVWYQIAFRWRRGGENIDGVTVYGAVDVAPEDFDNPGLFDDDLRVCRRHLRSAT
jgi:hypothetical protein